MSDKQTDRQTIVQIILLSGWFWFFDLSRSSNEIAITTFAFKVRLKQPASYQINTQQTNRQTDRQKDEHTKKPLNDLKYKKFRKKIFKTIFAIFFLSRKVLSQALLLTANTKKVKFLSFFNLQKFHCLFLNIQEF
jgi:hypothetical protein